MGDDERTIICMWLAAELVVSALFLPLAGHGPTMTPIIGMAAGMGAFGRGLYLLARRTTRR